MYKYTQVSLAIKINQQHWLCQVKIRHTLVMITNMYETPRL